MVDPVCGSRPVLYTEVAGSKSVVSLTFEVWKVSGNSCQLLSSIRVFKDLVESRSQAEVKLRDFQAKRRDAA